MAAAGASGPPALKSAAHAGPSEASTAKADTPATRRDVDDQRKGRSAASSALGSSLFLS